MCPILEARLTGTGQRESTSQLVLGLAYFSMPRPSRWGPRDESLGQHAAGS
jgi:hypothetical protein